MPGEMSKGKTLRIHICIVLTDCSVLVYHLVNSALRQCLIVSLILAKTNVAR